MSWKSSFEESGVRLGCGEAKGSVPLAGILALQQMHCPARASVKRPARVPRLYYRVHLDVHADAASLDTLLYI